MSEILPNPQPAASSPVLWRRLLFTPISDLIWGEPSARPDPVRPDSARPETVASDLPGNLAQLVLTVARRTRLWRRERADVARELTAHFRDGLDAGVEPEKLIKDFGDPVMAAKLLRRGKIRCRPLWYHAGRWTTRALAALVGFACLWFLFLTARYFWLQPNIARDHLEEINAPLAAVPLAERAWPVYRTTLRRLNPSPQGWEKIPPLVTVAMSPEAEGWDDAVAYLQEHAADLDQLRKAAARPRLGFVFNDPYDAAHYSPEKASEPLSPPRENEPLVSTPLAHVQLLRYAAMLLSVDARTARSAGDGSRFVSDVEAMLGLARQLADDSPFLIQDLVAVAVQAMALQQLGEALADSPSLIADEKLPQLAHRVSRFSQRRPQLMAMDGERRTLDDLWQRIYSDDGAGDGHLTARGMRLFSQLAGMSNGVANAQPDGWGERMAFNAQGIAVSGLIASRREMAAQTTRLMDLSERETSGPLWTWQPSQVDEELHGYASDPLQKLRYAPLLLLMPAYRSAVVARERHLQVADAALTALALESHRRAHGDWPAALDALVPARLPALPLDRCTGQPLVYKLVDGRPLLYSRGSDGVDDGGVAPSDPNLIHAGLAGIPARQGTAPGAGQSQMGWDWILWPAPPEKKNE